MAPPSGRRKPRLEAEKKDQTTEPDNHALGYSRGGWGTKVHLLVDGRGTPLGCYLTAGQRSEVHGVEPLLDPWQSTPVLDRYDPSVVTADKGYSSKAIRARIEAAGWREVIPHKSNERNYDPESFDNETYRRRNVVERCVGWLKECRRIATRFEKLAASFEAMLDLACLSRYFRLLRRTNNAI